MDPRMSMLSAVILLLFPPVILQVAGNGLTGLSIDYYAKTCPQLEKIVRDEILAVTSIDRTVPASMLRLLFHDCQVGGCDGSVLLDVNDPNKEAEFDSVKNFGIRNRELIDLIKLKVDTACGALVSCADLLVLAARDSVAVAGGPHIHVPLGRKDTITKYTRQEADVGLPRNNVNLTIALKIFAWENGIGTDEVVALLGAHTLGITHCDGVYDRLYEDESQVPPPGNEAAYVRQLKRECPKDGSNRFTKTFELDPTFTIFDNKFYKTILSGRALITLDAEIGRDPRTVETAKRFSKDQEAFFEIFTSGFLKISSLNVLTGDQGVIRKKCSVFD